jgi:hypothetical protein
MDKGAPLKRQREIALPDRPFYGAHASRCALAAAPKQEEGIANMQCCMRERRAPKARPML